MKILILSYHAIPMDVIASYHAMAYLKHFRKYGIEPTLLTHHWSQNNAADIVTTEDVEGGRVIRIPIKEKKAS